MGGQGVEEGQRPPKAKGLVGMDVEWRGAALDAAQARAEVKVIEQNDRAFFLHSIVRQLIPHSLVGREMKGRTAHETRVNASAAEVGKPIVHQLHTQPPATVHHQVVVREMAVVEVAQAAEAVEEVGAVVEAVVVVEAAEDLDNIVARKHH